VADVSGSAGQVEVHLFAAARAAVGESMVLVAPGSLSSVLDAVAADHPAFSDVRQ